MEKSQKSHYLNGRLIKTKDFIYAVRFLAYKEDGVVSLLKRKRDNLKSKNAKNTRISETYRRRVVEIKKVDSLPVRCIGVDSKSHLFLAGKFMIPTHNTEVGNNLVFYYMDLYPCPMLQVLHTEDIAKTHMKDKLLPSIKVMKHLDEKIIWAKGNQSESGKSELQFRGGSLKLGWAQTASTFAGSSRRVVVCDDVDRWRDDVGDEGYPVSLAKKRADSFINKKIFINSTPINKGESLIWEEFEESDKRHFYMPCPHCNQYIKFERENFIYESKNSELIGDVKFACYECGGLIEEKFKTQMMQQGRWIAEAKSKKIGFRLTAFCSPWLSWNEIFEEYLKALKLENDGKPNKIK